MSDEPESELRMVAVFRADLPLPEGKLAAQAGHAFLAAWMATFQRQPVPALQYLTALQLKIVLVAADLAALEGIKAKAEQRGVSAVLIMDAARTVLPEPTITVLGIGPMNKTDSNAITRGLAML